MLELADIFRKYGQEYLSLYGQDMLPSHTRALYDVANCQTEYFGGHAYECDHCGLDHISIIHVVIEIALNARIIILKNGWRKGKEKFCL